MKSCTRSLENSFFALPRYAKNLTKVAGLPEEESERLGWLGVAGKTHIRTFSME